MAAPRQDEIPQAFACKRCNRILGTRRGGHLFIRPPTGNVLEVAVRVAEVVCACGERVDWHFAEDDLRRYLARRAERRKPLDDMIRDNPIGDGG